MSAEELARFIGEVEDEEAPSEAEAQVTEAPAPVVAPQQVQPPPTPAATAREEWERIVLAAGLELHVRRDATAEVRRRAEEIVAGNRR
jgi:hypothetical protein